MLAQEVRESTLSARDISIRVAGRDRTIDVRAPQSLRERLLSCMPGVLVRRIKVQESAELRRSIADFHRRDFSALA